MDWILNLEISKFRRVNKVLSTLIMMFVRLETCSLWGFHLCLIYLQNNRGTFMGVNKQDKHQNTKNREVKFKKKS